jgi:hypothetical protein
VPRTSACPSCPSQANRTVTIRRGR